MVDPKSFTPYRWLPHDLVRVFYPFLVHGRRERLWQLARPDAPGNRLPNCAPGKARGIGFLDEVATIAHGAELDSLCARRVFAPFAGAAR